MAAAGVTGLGGFDHRLLKVAALVLPGIAAEAAEALAAYFKIYIIDLAYYSSTRRRDCFQYVLLIRSIIF